MAEHGALDTAAGGDAENYAEREQMYRRFLGILKYAIAAIVVVLALMGLYLT
jgi:hypothetical protein